MLLTPKDSLREICSIPLSFSQLNFMTMSIDCWGGGSVGGMGCVARFVIY